jgi:SAM-dependent methyltransferase
MRHDSIEVEEHRLTGVEKIEDYRWFKERHRVFPAVFENRNHKRVIDLSAGVGCAAKRIKELYNAEIICNDIAPTCLKVLNQLGLKTVSFNIDDPETHFPFDDAYFDAVISLATIEHLLYPDHLLNETRRILAPGGFFYICAPNYAAPEYMMKLLFLGRSFHEPLGSEEEKYEFYAHVRYYTYKTLRDFVSSFGFSLDTVYIAMPAGSSRYEELYARSRFKALAYKNIMRFRHLILSARWASEPILCFRKDLPNKKRRVRKVVL